MFIVIDGVDGSGKSTICKLIAEKLKEQSKRVILTSEPSCGNHIEYAKSIKDLIINGDLSNVSKLLMLNAIRVDHLTKIIIPALQEGKYIICDRFIYSTLVYQSIIGGIEEDIIYSLHKLVCNDIQPDLTIILDTNKEVVMNRMLNRNVIDNFDQLMLEHFDQMRNRFLEFARDDARDNLALPSNAERNKIINANNSVNVILQECMDIILQKSEKIEN